MAKTVSMTLRAARAVHDEERERVKWGWQPYPAAFSARSSVILSDVGWRGRLECGSGCARGDGIVPDCTSCAGTEAPWLPYFSQDARRCMTDCGALSRGANAVQPPAAGSTFTSSSTTARTAIGHW
jgi:hypothetical protein